VKLLALAVIALGLCILGGFVALAQALEPQPTEIEQIRALCEEVRPRASLEETVICIADIIDVHQTG
jgi:hypothetical protein